MAVHDYQLATVASWLRRLTPRMAIAYFLHTPFAPPAALRRLPARVAGRILEGMLSADLLGFQRPAWAEDFMSCCRLVGATPDVTRGLVCHRDRVTWVRCYPTPVDPAEVLERGSSAGVLRWARRLAAAPGERTVVRVDRLDPAKNALRGFHAFELLLERRPELRGRVRFLAFLVPSRRGVAEYREYAEQTLSETRRINGRFPDAVQVHEGDNRERALAALRGYDVLLVNAMRDGMNLVAQEGPLVNQVDGCVVLSAQVGAADLLGEGALPLYDPADTAATAESLERALAQGPPPELSQVVEVLFAALLRGATVFTLGNGGSSALAAHMACDLGKGCAMTVRPPVPGQPSLRLKITSLSDNSALLTAYANDIHYERVFVEQLRSLLDKDDVVIAISGSGASPNVLRAVEPARACGATAIGFTGAASSTAALATRCDIIVRAPLTRMEQVEDLHVTFNHVIALMLRRRIRDHLSAQALPATSGNSPRPAGASPRGGARCPSSPST